MKRIKEWMIEGFTGKKYIMGQYRKVSGIKPLRIATIYVNAIAIIIAIGVLIRALF